MWKLSCIWKSGSVTTKFYLESWTAQRARQELGKNRGIRKIELFRVDNNQE